jgi:3-dehydroquinate dehydratase
VSVIADLCFATVSGRGPEGYREALERVRDELARIGDAREGSGR